MRSALRSLRPKSLLPKSRACRNGSNVARNASDLQTTMAELLFQTQAKEAVYDLRYDDGDIVVDLYGEPSRCFLVHGSVLRKASPHFFGAGGKACWNKTATKFKHPTSGVQHKVTTYYLTYNKTDRVLLLDKTVSWDKLISYSGECFC